MVAYGVSTKANLLEQMRVLGSIVTHHEEGCLCFEAVQSVENEWCSLGDWTIVEGKIDSLPVRVYPPQCVGIEPSEDSWRLLDEHDTYLLCDDILFIVCRPRKLLPLQLPPQLHPCPHCHKGGLEASGCRGRASWRVPSSCRCRHSP